MIEGVESYLDNFGAFGIGNMLGGIFSLMLFIFLITLVVKSIKFASKGNKLASHFAKAIGFYLLSPVVSVCGMGIAMLIHDENIFEYVHYYSTLPHLLCIVISLYWLYRLYVEITAYSK